MCWLYKTVYHISDLQSKGNQKLYVPLSGGPVLFHNCNL